VRAFFDQIYLQNDFYYGLRASDELRELIESNRVRAGLALDIGAGEGRNSFYVARNGFETISIDVSRVGLLKAKKYAKKEGIDIEIVLADARYIPIDKSRVSLAICATLLNHLEGPGRDLVVQEIRRCLRKNGFVFVKVFTVDDPGFRGNVDESSNCAVSVIYYYEKRELLNQFAIFDIEYCLEKWECGDSHGKPHCHATATLVAKKAWPPRPSILALYHI